jgi:hypothetical protein
MKLLFVIASLLSVSCRSQIRMQFALQYDGQELQTEKQFYSREISDSIVIDVFRFYISNICLLKNDSIVWKEAESYHLVDAADKNSYDWFIDAAPNIGFDRISFLLGIDSTRNVSGVFSGALDPLKGMFWSWQSGYIDFKLEGRSPLCDTRKHSFQFHLGGYRSPYISAQTISLRIKNPALIQVNCELRKFLAGIDLSKQNSIMVPGREACELSVKAADIFSIR